MSRRNPRVDDVRSAAGTDEGPKTWREDNGVSKEVPLYPALPRKFAEVPLPTYTMAEVREYDTRESVIPDSPEFAGPRSH